MPSTRSCAAGPGGKTSQGAVRRSGEVDVERFGFLGQFQQVDRDAHEIRMMAAWTLVKLSGVRAAQGGRR